MLATQASNTEMRRAQAQQRTHRSTMMRQRCDSDETVMQQKEGVSKVNGKIHSLRHGAIHYVLIALV
ncbi:hypothetical protein NDU88_006166 [Pleurodeles waltl]|uniref:Uncharacterized protein n=1 Tax=Pleurodeles waltl TaxID=8319 RepID=A0AAV7QKF0_PLEWA|nr:hypothetical protein NDU88_006166 [Pleurodeles waltl]